MDFRALGRAVAMTKIGVDWARLKKLPVDIAKKVAKKVAKKFTMKAVERVVGDKPSAN